MAAQVTEHDAVLQQRANTRRYDQQQLALTAETAFIETCAKKLAAHDRRLQRDTSASMHEQNLLSDFAVFSSTAAWQCQLRINLTVRSVRTRVQLYNIYASNRMCLRDACYSCAECCTADM
eukprot:10456-Heterococcus_DN1.PRE.8